MVEDKVEPLRARIDIREAGININNIEIGSKVSSKIKLKPSKEVLSLNKI